ncbi:hypothetical protein JCM18899A_52490 [Nocardioides sp. AN3]
MSDERGRTKYPHISSEPMTIGPVDIRNRIFMAARGIPLDGPGPSNPSYDAPSADAFDCYAERARGGVGLLFHIQKVGHTADSSGRRNTLITEVFGGTTQARGARSAGGCPSAVGC